jgi:diguanylate cyclase (GGDEF)-like protein
MKEPQDSVAFRQSLLRLLQGLPRHENRLLAEIEAQQQKGSPVYSALIHILSHLSFSEAAARRHWKRIVAHRTELGERLGRDVGLRVALLDYFVNVSRELKNPKVIEIAIYQDTERSAITDGLTGLSNRLSFQETVARELSRSRRFGLKMSVALFDLDDFKRINDTFGHLAGDRFLVKAAAIMRESLRDIDTAARYGGEEFAALLPDTPPAGAFVVADRIRARVEAHVRQRRGRGVSTLSGGVATFPEDGRDFETLMRRADEALYRSKASGKNRITEASQDPKTRAGVVSSPGAVGAPDRRRPVVRRTR